MNNYQNINGLVFKNMSISWRKRIPIQDIDAKCKMILPSAESQTVKNPTNIVTCFSENILPYCVEKIYCSSKKKMLKWEEYRRAEGILIGSIMMSQYAKYISA